jgi:plastocyanin
VLKKAMHYRLPYGRGSVSTCKHAAPILSHAREQVVLRLFQHPVTGVAGSTGGLPASLRNGLLQGSWLADLIEGIAMKLLCAIASLLFLALSFLTLDAVAGDVSGHALVTKRLTKKALSPIVYNLRGTTAPAAPPDSTLVNEFDRMVMILEGGKLPPRAPISVVLNQQGARFDPELVVVPTGSTVQFPNLDPIFHNVFSLSKTRKFDLGYFPQGQSRSVKFNDAGIVQVYCHIHANMYAAIVVTDSPWYTKPGADGSFSFSNVPAGNYRLTVWHKIAGYRKVNVVVPETGSVDLNISVPVDME